MIRRIFFFSLVLFPTALLFVLNHTLSPFRSAISGDITSFSQMLLMCKNLGGRFHSPGTQRVLIWICLAEIDLQDLPFTRFRKESLSRSFLLRGPSVPCVDIFSADVLIFGDHSCLRAASVKCFPAYSIDFRECAVRWYYSVDSTVDSHIHGLHHGI